MAFIITPDDNRLHTLNAIATHIWQLSEHGFTEAETVVDTSSDAETYFGASMGTIIDLDTDGAS